MMALAWKSSANSPGDPRTTARAVGFGIRGFDLACAILDGYDAVMLIDAVSRGGRPGTLYVIEPDLGPRAAIRNEGGKRPCNEPWASA